MKESEARNKWCPQNLGQDGSNESGLCIGSGCMMWESWEFIDGSNKLVGKNTGDCGLKTKELNCNI